MQIESGPAAGDRNYFLIVTLLCTGMFIYFIYDWQIGYPAENQRKAREGLAALLSIPPEEVKIPDPERPTKPEYQAAFNDENLTVENLAERFGEPILRKTVSNAEYYSYYASNYGMAEVHVRNGRIIKQNMNWQTWYKTKQQVAEQFWFSLIPLAVGLYTGYRVYRAVTLRVVVDDEGLNYGGRRIPFDAIVEIRDYNRKGWVDLYYENNGRRQKLRLDNQKFKRFDEVVAALCVAKGFENPLPSAAAENADPPQTAAADADAPQDDADRSA